MYRVADNIISPLGLTTEENYRAVCDGRSALRRYEGLWNLPEPFVASLLDRQVVESAFSAIAHNDRSPVPQAYTFFEKMVILSVSTAAAQVPIDLASERVIFVLSTTKGNVHLLAESDNWRPDCPGPSPFLGASARAVARFFGNGNTPIVVSNACTSGVCAQIEALRLLQTTDYDFAVVAGADMQSPFIVSGFQSFKALSPEPCRPFDATRAGLNLGEAAATLIYARHSQDVSSQVWRTIRGAIRNDANHISGPSRTGEGSFQALNAVLKDFDTNQLAVVSVHGTATNYNDEMESIALQRAELSEVPVSGLKGYFGHTMGAAGILETILTMRALDDGMVLGTKGFGELGVSCSMSISNHHRPASGKAFVKLLSGFGGCNAALLFQKGQEDRMTKSQEHIEAVGGLESGTLELRHTHTVELTDHTLRVDGAPQPVAQTGRQLLSELYSSRIADYPKFYKMDPLTKVGFVASELLLQAERETQSATSSDTSTRAVRLVGVSGSLADDQKYQSTISDPDKFFPSPAIFVYTLPNIVTGEIAIRNHYHGETNFLLLDHNDPEAFERCVRNVFQDPATYSAIVGWIDCFDDDHYRACLSIVVKPKPGAEPSYAEARKRNE